MKNVLKLGCFFIEGEVMRSLEKISFEQFKKDIKNDKKLYEEYLLPVRSTQNSAGYDFKAIEDFIIPAGKKILVPTGIKVKMNSNEVFFILIRSSFGIKKHIILSNQVGVIDADYYNNMDNEGHIWIALENCGTEDYKVLKKEHYAQGIFIPYLICENEDKVQTIRKGSFGSTDKGEERK